MKFHPMSDTRNPPLWQPSDALLRDSAMARFMSEANRRHELELEDYEELWRWSVDQREAFWALVWEFFGVKASKSRDSVLEHDTMPGAKWFEGARLNFAENLLRYRDDRTALVFRNEHGARRSFTYAELYDEVSRVRAGLDALGVGQGDRVDRKSTRLN